jgi:hypothetical protein
MPIFDILFNNSLFSDYKKIKLIYLYTTILINCVASFCDYWMLSNLITVVINGTL